MFLGMLKSGLSFQMISHFEVQTQNSITSDANNTIPYTGYRASLLYPQKSGKRNFEGTECWSVWSLPPPNPKVALNLSPPQSPTDIETNL